MASRKIKYENGIAVDIVTREKEDRATLDSYMAVVYYVGYGASEFMCETFESAVDKVNELSLMLVKQELQRRRENEAIDKIVEKFDTTIKLKKRENGNECSDVIAEA